MQIHECETNWPVINMNNNAICQLHHWAIGPDMFFSVASPTDTF